MGGGSPFWAHAGAYRLMHAIMRTVVEPVRFKGIALPSNSSNGNYFDRVIAGDRHFDTRRHDDDILQQ